MPNKLWDISQTGADSIRTLEQHLIDSVDHMEQSYDNLFKTFSMLSQDMGIYAELVDESLQVMKKVNEDCKKSMESLIKRLAKYARKIEDELSKSDL